MCRLRRIANSLKWRRSQHTGHHTSQANVSVGYVQDPHAFPPTTESQLRRSQPSTYTAYIFDQDVDTETPPPPPVPTVLSAKEPVLSAETAPAPNSEPHAVAVDGLADIRRPSQTGPLRYGIAVTVMAPAGYVQIGEVVFFGISADGEHKIPGDPVTIEPTMEDANGQ